MIFLTDLIRVASLLLGDKEDEIPDHGKADCVGVAGWGWDLKPWS